MGTPAEESEAGKAMLLRKGAFRDIDVAIMAHPGRQDCLRLAFTSSQKVCSPSTLNDFLLIKGAITRRNKGQLL
ncbi:hypothetical protein HPB48_022294 [Haemaphysalis longicornis]|uniref:Uncharacterized protein n=1 Tax=Haemaphysalis longicornis TaxID=44386 RepID=A0A9J6G0V4_HAELO|nr:hypothetical protein HPB48_022294 [Haemaphysalis longicornis]